LFLCFIVSFIVANSAATGTLAVQMLGIDRVALWRKLKKYGQHYACKAD
jgi:DNA-binding protein Fis